MSDEIIKFGPLSNSDDEDDWNLSDFFGDWQDEDEEAEISALIFEALQVKCFSRIIKSGKLIFTNQDYRDNWNPEGTQFEVSDETVSAQIESSRHVSIDPITKKWMFNVNSRKYLLDF